MVTRADNGIYRTEARESHTLPVAATDAAPGWSGWEKWLAGHLAIEREETNRCIGMVLGELQCRIRDLEGRLAEARRDRCFARPRRPGQLQRQRHVHSRRALPHERCRCAQWFELRRAQGSARPVPGRRLAIARECRQAGGARRARIPRPARRSGATEMGNVRQRQNGNWAYHDVM
jgi:hypothetical protein